MALLARLILVPLAALGLVYGAVLALWAALQLQRSLTVLDFDAQPALRAERVA